MAKKDRETRTDRVVVPIPRSMYTRLSDAGRIPSWMDVVILEDGEQTADVNPKDGESQYDDED